MKIYENPTQIQVTSIKSIKIHENPTQIQVTSIKSLKIHENPTILCHVLQLLRPPQAVGELTGAESMSPLLTCQVP